jgi:PAS domain S-box-containing protein
VFHEVPSPPIGGLLPKNTSLTVISVTATAPTRTWPGLASRHAGATASPPPVRPPLGATRVSDVTLARAARVGADMVGDACVIWRVVDDGRQLEPAAVHHRDRRMRPALESFLEQQTLAPDVHWPGQVASHRAPVRLRKARLRDLGIGPGVGLRRAHALLTPVLDGDRPLAVIAAFRDSSEPEYSLREEVVLRRVAAKAAAGLGVGLTGTTDGGDPGDGGDGSGRDPGDGEPPAGGPGWTPPPHWLMDHVGVGVWITDRQGVTTYVNSAMTELLGMPSPKVVGRPMRDFLDDVPQMLRGEYCMDAERCDRRLTQPDGRHVWLEMTSAPLVDDEGRRRGTVNTVIDVTERKRVELAARQRVPRAHRRA